MYALHISTPLSHPNPCSDGLVCNESFYEVIGISLHMSVITQDGDSPLIAAAKEGRAEVIANLHLQLNKVKMSENL